MFVLTPRYYAVLNQPIRWSRKAEILKNIMFPEIVVCSLLITTTTSIVSLGFQDCRSFFYQEEPPRRIMNAFYMVPKTLCERYNGRFYFATEYDPRNKMPFYSAYSLTTFDRAKELLTKSDKERIWRKGEGLTNEEQPFKNTYDGVQAAHLNRGHLATRFFFPTNDGRKSTDVLTNIALQYELFNKFTWFKLEKSIFDLSKYQCNIYGGVSYFVTGVIPSLNFPFNGKINIPSDFWTAVCCDTSNVKNDNNKFKGWSFAYVAQNINSRESQVDIFTMRELLMDIRLRFRYTKIFKDKVVSANGANRWVNDCSFDYMKAYEIMADIETSFKRINNLSVHKSNPLLSLNIERLSPAGFQERPFLFWWPATNVGPKKRQSSKTIK